METFFVGIPTEAWGPFLLWIFVIILQLPWVFYCINKIEKSGVKRWGATGSFFKYQ